MFHTDQLQDLTDHHTRCGQGIPRRNLVGIRDTEKESGGDPGYREGIWWGSGIPRRNLVGIWEWIRLDHLLGTLAGR